MTPHLGLAEYLGSKTDWIKLEIPGFQHKFSVKQDTDVEKIDGKLVDTTTSIRIGGNSYSDIKQLLKTKNLNTEHGRGRFQNLVQGLDANLLITGEYADYFENNLLTVDRESQIAFSNLLIEEAEQLAGDMKLQELIFFYTKSGIQTQNK